MVPFDDMPQVDEILDSIFDLIDNLLYLGYDGVIDGILREWPVEHLGLVIGVLTAARPKKHALSEWHNLLNRAKDYHKQGEDVFQGLD